MAYEEAIDYLEPTDPSLEECYLSRDTLLRVVDVLDIGIAREQQITKLRKLTEPKERQTVDELADDDEDKPYKSDASITKYTVKDARSNMAFLLPFDVLPTNLKLGCQIVLLKGTVIWRTVLVPRSHQIRVVGNGMQLTIDQQIMRLRREA